MELDGARRTVAHIGVKARQGVIITGVLQNGPAAQAGIRPGDVITDVAGKPVTSVSGLLASVALDSANIRRDLPNLAAYRRAGACH